MFAYPTSARCCRPARGARRGAARAGLRRGGRAPAVRAAACAGWNGAELARGGHRRGFPARLAGRRRRARGSAGRRPPARARDLRRRRPRDDGAPAGQGADLRDRRCACARARARGGVRAARRSRRSDRSCDQRTDGPARCRPARLSASGDRSAALPRICRRRRPRRAQRALRPRIPRPRDRAPRRCPARGPRGRHGGARAAPARRPHAPGRARVARPVLRHGHATVSPCTPRCAGDRGDPVAADRPRPGARCTQRR